MKLSKILYKGRIRELQSRRFRKFKRILKKSKYYHDLANNQSELKDFPIINKKTFMDHFDAISTVDVSIVEAKNVAHAAEKSRDFSSKIRGITIGMSSGTSGNQSIFMASERERAIWVAAVLDRVIGFQLKKRKVAFFLRADSPLYQSVKSKLLKFDFFDLFTPIKQHIERLNKLKPNILVGQPSLLLELAKQQDKGNLKIKPDKIISVAEVLYPEDAVYLENIFNQKIHQLYQCSEGFLAASCPFGYLHFNEDLVIIEKKYIDESKTRFHPIITDLIRQTQPIIRYELNDIIHEKKKCECGSEFMAIEKIEGRSDDIITLVTEENDKVIIYPDFFRRAIVMSDKTVYNYELIFKGGNSFSLFIEGNDLAYEKAKKAIIDMLSKKDIVNIAIIRGATLSTQNANKLRRIRNDYRKSD